MQAVEQIGPSSSSSSGLPTILQVILSAIGLVLGLMVAGLLALVGLAGVFGESTPLSDAVPLFSTAWVALLVAALAVPSLVYSSFRLAGRALPQIPQIYGYRLAWIFLLLWPLLLTLGNFISKSQSLGWLLLPPLNLLAIGIPIWWVIEIARHRLTVGSEQRGWGLINFTLILSTPLILIVEIIGLLGVIIVAAVAISSQPDLAAEVLRLAAKINGLQNNPENLLPVIMPLLSNPLVIFAVLAVLSGMAPLVEEMFKPLALWALVGSSISPAEGFAAGAVCGGTFALLESLMNLTGPPGDSWLSLVAARSGTALLHITTTALLGWGMAYAWRYGAYVRLGATYLLSALLHGVWNAISVFIALSTVLEDPPDNLAWISNMTTAGPIAMAIFIVVLFLILWGVNRRLRQNSVSAASIENTPLPSTSDKIDYNREQSQ